jgi:hypothetical protein
VTLHHSPAAQNRLAPADAPAKSSPECREVLANFWDYLDGNCSPELAGRIDAHVASCVPCLGVGRLQERFFASLAEVRERSPAPPRIHGRGREALAAERAQNRRR